MKTTYGLWQKRLVHGFSIFIGILGLGTVIIIHELGHWVLCRLYDVTTPLFSIGFGPTLFTIPLEKTIFQVALLPFGGYVSIDPEMLAAQSYVTQMTIFGGGILANIATGFAIFMVLPQSKKILYDEAAPLNNNKWHAPVTNALNSLKEYGKIDTPSNAFVGPLGIVHLISKSVASGPYFFFSVMASLNLSIGIFNLLPFPFLDGGKMLILTIQQWFPISNLLDAYASFVSGVIIILFITILSLKDIRGIIRRG